MAWDQYVDTSANGYAQWRDAALSRACFQKSQQLARVDQRALNGQGWEAQRAAVLLAWTWLARGFLALTVPALFYPGYRDTVAAWTPPRRELAGQLLRRVGETTPLGPSNMTRAWLDEDSRVVAPCMGSDPTAGEGCAYASCVESGSTVGLSADERGCDPYTWNTLAWSVEDGVAFVIAPARWCLELCDLVAARALAAGPEQIVQQTRAFTDVHNLAEAARLGLDLPASLRDLAQRLPSDLDAARWASGPMQEWGHAIQAAGAAAAAANPAVGAAVTLFGTLVASLPNAVGADPMTTAVDVAGRTTWWKPTTYANVDRAPSGGIYNIPWPDGVAHPVVLPGFVTPHLIDGPTVLREIRGDCARWRSLSLSAKSDTLTKLGYDGSSVGMGAMDAYCAGADPDARDPGKDLADAMGAGGAPPPPPPPPAGLSNGAKAGLVALLGGGLAWWYGHR